MMLSDVGLSDVCRVHPVGGRRVRPAGWRVLARPAWLKAAAARFRCRPGRGHTWRPLAYSLLIFVIFMFFLIFFYLCCEALLITD